MFILVLRELGYQIRPTAETGKTRFMVRVISWIVCLVPGKTIHQITRTNTNHKPSFDIVSAVGGIIASPGVFVG